MAKRTNLKAGKYKNVAQEFPGVTHYKDRHGKLRWRYREGKFITNLGTEYGSEEFVARYKAAVNGERLTSVRETVARTSQAPRGSLSSVLDSWYKSPDFVSLGETTKKNYRGIAERLRNDHGEDMVSQLNRATIKALMAKKAETPAAANHVLRILRLALDHAMDDMEIIDTNPARDVKKYQGNNPDGYHTWTEAEIARFFKRWPEGTTANLVMSLMLYTGAAKVDAVKLGAANLVDGRLKYSRQKMRTRGGAPVDIPVHPALMRKLEPIKEQETFLQTADGKPRSPNGLGNMMRRWCDAVQDANGKILLPECTSHGLRKACARRLAEAGATPHEIMAVTGHKTLAEVERYTDKVNRAALADTAIKKGSDAHEDGSPG